MSYGSLGQIVFDQARERKRFILTRYVRYAAFAISQKNTNDSCKPDVCDTQQTTHSDELFAMRNYNTDGYYSKFVYDSVRTKNIEKSKVVACI